MAINYFQIKINYLIIYGKLDRQKKKKKNNTTHCLICTYYNMMIVILIQICIQFE